MTPTPTTPTPTPTHLRTLEAESTPSVADARAPRARPPPTNCLRVGWFSHYI